MFLESIIAMVATAYLWTFFIIVAMPGWRSAIAATVVPVGFIIYRFYPEYELLTFVRFYGFIVWSILVSLLVKFTMLKARSAGVSFGRRSLVMFTGMILGFVVVLIIWALTAHGIYLLSRA